MRDLLIICAVSVIVGSICGAFLPRLVAFGLAILTALILPPVASVLHWPADPRNRESVLTTWFSREAVGLLAIPWSLCLIAALGAVFVGRWLRGNRHI